ncbi:TonB-dependent receptor [Pontibacter sp. 172403-2]|uniref:TonB-dependent receptor domain-containing protein n=1 Tax=Pontibacter rufus TaxID=2791028 RepID=UPI0018AFDFD0|nr:TonB-dependent receptor [Pontibacter sp. 172403-2]MBF9252300.1 TonB-dependent receptor [Pontibacter sp. 172403-2]
MNKYLSSLVLACCCQVALAQSPSGGASLTGSAHSAGGVAVAAVQRAGGSISGAVVDAATQQPVPYATIALVNPATSKPVDGTMADEKGKFSLEKVASGAYRVAISFIGYETKTIDIEVTDSKSAVDLGKISIKATAQALKEVTVEGQRAMIEEKVDRTVYNAENDESNRGGDAADVLRKVPMLSVDLDGNVSMRGSQNIKVLINNRPSTITAGSVADALKQIPADMIKSVEVITSPSAKYDAEGSAGIINIVTKKNTLKGGTLNIDTGVGLRGSNLGLNGSYRVGKMGFSLGGFGRLGYNTPGSFENVQTTGSDAEQSTILQQADTRNNMMFGRYTFGWDYDINEKNYLNASVQYGARNWQSNQDPLLTQLYQGSSLVSRTLRDVETTDNSGTVDVNLNYTHTFKPQQEFSILTQFSRNNRTNNFLNEIFNSEETSIDTRLKNINESFNQESTIQLDYTNPIGKNQMLEFGGKQIMRQVTSDYETLTAEGTGPFTKEASTNLSNVFNYDQNVSAGYLSYTLTTANNYSMKAGARYEYTTINADFENSEEAVNIPSYGVLVPSINLSKRLKDGNTVKLAYNRRIQRPSLEFLNPNVQNANPAVRTVGNPELDPEYTNNYELSYSTYFKTTSLNFSTFVRTTNNSIQAVRERAEDGVLETSYFNIGQEEAYGGSVFGSINLSNKLTLNGGTDIYYAVLNNNVDDAEQQASNSGLVYNIRAMGNYNLGQGWGIQGFGFYRGRQVQLQGRQGGFGIYSLNLKKEFNERRGSIGFGAENFLSPTMKMKSELNSPAFSQTSTNVMHNMNFKVNFSYRIGKMTADATPRRRKKSVNNDDLKGGGEGGVQDAGGATQGALPGAAATGAATQGARPGQAAGQQPAQAPVTAPSTAQATSTNGIAGQPAQTLPADSTQQGSLTGRWKGAVGDREITLDLVADSTALTGSMQTPMGQMPLTGGMIAGDAFSFTLSFGGNSIPYKGKIEGDNITLKADFQGQPVEIKMERVK